jgi:hypothetical protein
MTKLEQVARLCAVVSRDAGGPYPETVDDPCGGLIDRDEALSAATIDNREAYALGVGETLKSLDDEIGNTTFGGINLDILNAKMRVVDAVRRLIKTRLEAMKNGK